MKSIVTSNESGLKYYFVQIIFDLKHNSISGTSSPQITVGPTSGDVVAVWSDTGVIVSGTKLFGMSWSSPTRLSSSNSHAPQVAISAEGTVVATWHTFNGMTSLFNVYARTNPMTGSWSTAAEQISNSSQHSVYPKVVSGGTGHCIALVVCQD